MITADVLSRVSGINHLRMEATLRPAQGVRFQPTGFPDLGAATFTAPNGQSMLLVESAQSVANRLEAVCWDQAAADLVTPLHGLPYVEVRSSSGKLLTTSVLEAHRLNSPYVLDANNRELRKTLAAQLLIDDDHPFDVRRVAQLAFRYDPNSVLHGLFLAQQEIGGGRYRLRRLISGFVEATNAVMVESGGVKNDVVDATGTQYGGGAKEGFGNVPFHRTEFAAETITAYFSIDLAQLRAYRLDGANDSEPKRAEELLILLGLWKLRRFLEGDLRLRTACDLQLVDDLRVTNAEIEIPGTEDLAAALKERIAACADAGLFAKPAVTKVTFAPKKPAKGATAKAAESDEGGDR